MSNDKLTIRDISILLGVHVNTVRNYIRRGTLTAEKIMVNGHDTWVVNKDYLYNCGVPEILSKLGPQDVSTRHDNALTRPYKVPDKWLEELTRLNRENSEINRQLSEANAEREIMRYKVERMLPAAEEERDRLKVDAEQAKREVEVVRGEVKEVKMDREKTRIVAEGLGSHMQLLEQALEEARANAKWSWRRRQARATGLLDNSTATTT
ncbi:MAG: hypothetical protein KJ686_05620 [Actinobacteria bacterium]|nr:hypothetical protein [Actinomycetota bacterium]